MASLEPACRSTPRRNWDRSLKGWPWIAFIRQLATSAMR
jgi:hypothetical protein